MKEDPTNRTTPKDLVMAALVIFSAIVFAGIAILIIGLSSTPDSRTAGPILQTVLLTVLTAGVYFYSIYGYKLPNNNILKMIMIIFGVALIAKTAIAFNDMDKNAGPWIILCAGLGSGCIFYMSGRLKKLKDGLIFASIAGLFLLAIAIIYCVVTYQAYPITDNNFYSPFVGVLTNTVTTFSLWVLIVLNYVYRYHEFREIKLEAEENK